MTSLTNSSALADVSDNHDNESEKRTIEQLISRSIRDDPPAVDLLWSLFMSALNSYRHDTVLRPFPPMFQQGLQGSLGTGAGGDGSKDIQGLEKLANELPNIPSLLRDVSLIDGKLLELFWWVLDKRQFTVKSLKRNELSDIQKKTGHVIEVSRPNYLFELVYSEAAENKFEEFRQGRQLMYAYHGSRVENFHSILHHGLASHMNKNSLFGEGTYLSSELSVSLPYSPGGQAWEASELGDRLSCIAVCEMIDDTSIKCQIKEDENGTSRRGSRTYAPSSMGGEVPEKYYVVTNNDMIRVKYLLVYGEKSSAKGAQQQTPWLARHKFAIMMGFYLLVLVIIGLANSRTFQYHMKKILKSR